MASEAQIAANRRNAQRSTGPKSAEGKARVALNGLKHGLCSQRVLLPDEDPAEFEALVADLAARWRPADAAEMALVRDYAAAMWRLDRIPALEADLLRSVDGDLGETFLAHSHEILRLSLHEGRIARQRERARKELEALQAARRARAAELALDSQQDPRLPLPGRVDGAPRRPAERQRPAGTSSPHPEQRPVLHPDPLPQERERKQDQGLARELALLSQIAA